MIQFPAPRIALLAGTAALVATYAVAQAPAGPGTTGPAMPEATRALTPPAEPDGEAAAAAVDAYLAAETGEDGFRMYDALTRQELFLTHKKTDAGSLLRTHGSLHVLAATFTAPDGGEYTVDFFVRGTTADDLAVVGARTAIRAVDGKARYSWRRNSHMRLYEQRAPETASTPSSE